MNYLAIIIIIIYAMGAGGLAFFVIQEIIKMREETRLCKCGAKVIFETDMSVPAKINCSKCSDKKLEKKEEKQEDLFNGKSV
jgi:hypothetical protein